MEYSVGSLADLITSQKQPKQSKVKKIKRKVQATEDDTVESQTNSKLNGKAQSIEAETNGIESKTKISKKRKSANASPASPKKLKIESDEGDKETSDAESGDKETSDAESEDNETEEPTAVKKEKFAPTPEELARTIFIGNVPVKTTKTDLKKRFKKYGKIDSIRIRGVAVADPKLSKKVAVIKKKFHPDRQSVYSYIKFVEEESARKALQENGTLFENHHLSVQPGNVKQERDESKAIFIGNLSFKAEEEDLWKLFASCGPISHIRIIRDRVTGMGKGFAYINFHDSDAVQLALEMENVMLCNRELRIKPSSASSAKKNQNRANVKQRWRNKNKTPANGTNDDKSSSNGDEKPVSIEKSDFQGTKFNVKKKKKVNKGNLKKKLNVKKVAPIAKQE
ncbi:unnamed protein product [Phyllotreta striolata]|uniref:RRM domain-containing protein n=1 Tax=Phyllotreta striolata TaxID=444603 RepID=A0A9N9TNW3_PHYSR|nr:unnamed protein product [Phyllotreta striolata]